MNKMKKLISLLLSIVMVIGMLPMQALATDTTAEVASGDTGETEELPVILSGDTSYDNYYQVANGTEYLVRIENNEDAYNAFLCVAGDGSEYMITAFDIAGKTNVQVNYWLYAPGSDSAERKGQWFDPNGVSIEIPEGYELQMQIFYTMYGTTGDIVFQALADNFVPPVFPEYTTINTCEYSQEDPFGFIPGIEHYINVDAENPVLYGMLPYTGDVRYTITAIEPSFTQDVELTVTLLDENGEVFITDTITNIQNGDLNLPDGYTLNIEVCFADPSFVDGQIMVLIQEAEPDVGGMIILESTNEETYYNGVFDQAYAARIKNSGEAVYIYLPIDPGQEYHLEAFDMSGNRNLILEIYDENGNCESLDGNPLMTTVCFPEGTEAWTMIKYVPYDIDCTGDIYFMIAPVGSEGGDEGPAIVDSGSFGNGFTWSLNDWGALYIDGKGAMPDFEDNTQQPWDAYRDEIYAISVGEDVTRIGDYAFAGTSAFEASFTMNEKLESIGDYAFADCSGLSTVSFCNGITVIENYAFAGCGTEESEMGSGLRMYFETKAPLFTQSAFVGTSAHIFYEGGSDPNWDVLQELSYDDANVYWYDLNDDGSDEEDAIVIESRATDPTVDEVDSLYEVSLGEYLCRVKNVGESVWVKFTAPADATYEIYVKCENSDYFSYANRYFYDAELGGDSGGSGNGGVIREFAEGEVLVIELWFREDQKITGDFNLTISEIGATEPEEPDTDEIVIAAQNMAAAFPDENFRDYILQNVDANGDGQLSANEIADTTQIVCCGWGIYDLTGIAYFTNLVNLDCSYNNIFSLDLYRNTKLEILHCQNFLGEEIEDEFIKLTELDLSNNSALKELYCYDNALTELDLSACTELVDLDCSGNDLETLNLSGLTKLETLWCGHNEITELDVSDCTQLRRLTCYSNRISTLDVSNLTSLEYLWCQDNDITELDVADLGALLSIECSDNHITKLDLSNNALLEGTTVGDQSVDIINGSILEGGVEGYNCTIDLSAYVGDNVTNIVSVCDLDGNPALVSGNRAYFSNKVNGFTYTYLVPTHENAGLADVILEVCVQGMDSGEDTSQIVIPAEEMAKEFPDDVFRRYVLNNADRNGDGALSKNEIEGCFVIDASWSNVSDLTGLQWFPNLRHLSVNGIGLKTLDVSFLPELTELHCYNNQLTKLDLSNNSKLTYLEADSNKLTELDVSNLTELETIWVSGNPITQLDLSANTKLQNLYASNCCLTDLDLTNNSNLEYVDIEQQNLHVDTIAQEYDSQMGIVAVDLTQFSFIDLSRINYVFASDSFDASTGIATFNMREVIDLYYRYQVPGAQGGYYEMGILLTTECVHDWIRATCTTLQTCTICGITVGDYAHEWISGNCTTPRTCFICGATEGGVVHSWTEATCSTPKTCTLCEFTEGTAVACKAGSWVTTEYDSGTYLVRSCVWCGGTLETKEVDLLPGILTDLTDEALNAFEAELVDTDSNLADLVLTEEEKAAVEAGALAHVSLTVDDITDTVDPDYEQYLEDWLGNEQIAAFLDIDMYKQVGTAEPEQITSSSNDAQFAITLQLSEDLYSTDPNMSRNFYALYVSDDGVDHVDSEYDFYTHTITIYTNHFSVYAIAYAEYESNNEPIHLDMAGSYTANLTEANDYQQRYYYIAPADGKVTLKFSVEDQDRRSFGYGFNNVTSDIRSIREEDVTILSVAAGDVVDISFDEWSRNGDTEVNFTIDFTDEESQYPMDGRVVLSKLRKNDYTGLLYHWTAEESGTIHLELLSHLDAQPVLQVIKTSGYYESCYSSFDTLEVPVVAGDQITVQILTESIECSETYDDGGVDTWIEYPESTVIWKGEFVEDLNPVAVIGDVEYATLSEALANAKSGDTVTLVADAYEESTNLIVDEGVTLNIGQFDMHCRSLNVLTGGMISGGEYSQNGDWGKIYLPAASRMVMSGMVVENDGSIGLIPVWDDAASCYVFGGAFFNTANYIVAVDETAKTLSFKFIPSLRTKLMQGYFQDANEMRDNGLRLVLRLTWPGADENGNINGQAQQDFVYSSEFVKTYMDKLGSARFTFLLTGYDTLVTDDALAEMTITPMFISDTGMSFTGQTVRIADILS